MDVNLNGQRSSHSSQAPPPFAVQNHYTQHPHPPPQYHSQYQAPTQLSYSRGTESTGSSPEANKRGRLQGEEQRTPSGNFPSIMVYPPPPPAAGERYNPPSVLERPNDRSRDTVLPSVESWARPAGGSTQNPYTQNITGWGGDPSRPRGSPLDQSWAQQSSTESVPQSTRPVKHERGVEGDSKTSGRPLSDPGEVEASLALAGLKRRDSAPAVKKVKKEKAEPKDKSAEPKKKGEKDGKKSCAECRRLKAKCDRVFPCSNCVRRGCALVCPDGDLSCMQGKRLVLASTEQLHERIAHLETALHQVHSKVSSTHHPLLAPEYLDGGFASLPPPQLQQSPDNHSPTSGSNSHPELSRSPKGISSASSLILATPQMTERSSSQGRMAVESLLLTEESAAPEGKREDEWAGENAAPAMIIGTVGNHASDDLDERHQVFERLKKILKVLPPREEVQRRSRHFWDTSLWYQTILRREEFDTIYEPAVFAPTPANPLSPHKLACVLIVLTLDCYLDTSADEDNAVVARYWDAVQRCFDTRFGWAASVAGVQALGLITLFVGFGWRGARASNFYWLRQMTAAAMQLGLHKDPHPSLPEEEREFRRRVFHEVFILDCLICLNHGQRTAIPCEYIEATYPKNTSILALKKYEFMKLVKSQVIDIGCLPDCNPATWDRVNAVKNHLMQFDVTALPDMHCPLLRGEPVPEPAQGFTKEEALALQTTTTSMCHYKAMLYLFRPALRRLVARLRTQPKSSIVFDDADRECVSMTYRACHAITLTSYYMARKHPKLMGRCWMVWVQTFSAAVSMAALAIWCGPHLENTFVNSAYQELSEACDMIGENGSKRSLGVLTLLPILKTLVSNRYPQVIGKSASDVAISQESEDMLFALLGGQVDNRDNVSNPGSLSTSTTPVNVPPAPGPAPSQPRLQGWTEPPAQAPPQSQFIKGSVGVSQPYLGANGLAQNHQLQEPLINPTSGPESFAMVNPYAQTAGWFFPQSNDTGEMVLPLAQAAPTAVPFDYGLDMGSANTTASAEQTLDLSVAENPTELWARLQTFYEPAPVFWGMPDMGPVAAAATANPIRQVQAIGTEVSAGYPQAMF
ncbi:hypothetical protein IAU60_003683 [Kwoniella sp. DSM 27419]